MLHRVTWFAACALVVVGVGSTVGYWGYNQKQQRDALALHAEAQYESAFHNLVNDVSGMRSELAMTMLTQDNHVFQSHLGDISRLSYAAQNDAARLPSNLTPSYQLHAYLNSIETNVERWIKQGVPASNRNAKKQISTYYDQSATLASQLRVVQDQLNGHVDTWVNRRSAGATMAADGMKKVDGQVAAFAKSAVGTSAKPTPQGKNILEAQKTVNARVAIARVVAVANVKNPQGWTAKLYQAKTSTAYFSVKGTANSHLISAEVTEHGGILLTYYNDRSVSASKYDYAQAYHDAKKWLAGRGYRNVERQDSNQYDHTATFTFLPTVQGIPVMGQPIEVHVALDNGEITGFNCTAVIQHPIGNVPTRKFTEMQLQSKLSPDFRVQLIKPVIALDENGQYVPAVVFYGTHKQDTFRVILDATNGTEMKADLLS